MRTIRGDARARHTSIVAAMRQAAPESLPSIHAGDPCRGPHWSAYSIVTLPCTQPRSATCRTSFLLSAAACLVSMSVAHAGLTQPFDCLVAIEHRKPEAQVANRSHPVQSGRALDGDAGRPRSGAARGRVQHARHRLVVPGVGPTAVGASNTVRGFSRTRAAVAGTPPCAGAQGDPWRRPRATWRDAAPTERRPPWSTRAQGQPSAVAIERLRRPFGRGGARVSPRLVWSQAFCCRMTTQYAVVKTSNGPPSRLRTRGGSRKTGDNATSQHRNSNKARTHSQHLRTSAPAHSCSRRASRVASGSTTWRPIDNKDGPRGPPVTPGRAAHLTQVHVPFPHHVTNLLAPTLRRVVRYPNRGAPAPTSLVTALCEQVSLSGRHHHGSSWAFHVYPGRHGRLPG